MVTCEQFIFTAAKIDTREGYQVTAKSKGISTEIVQNLREYLFPLGIDEEKFQSSKSLIELNKNKIAYSIVKNIGVGYDGRRGTLYNHTFVIAKNNFEQLYNDSRIFDDYFIEDYSKQGELKTVQITPKKIPPKFKILNKLEPNVLKLLLFRLFKKTKIALINTDEIEIIPNLLAMLPPALRVTSFSTLVNDPLRQYRYDVMQIPQSAKNKLPSRTSILDPSTTKSIPKQIGTLEDIIDVLVEIIVNESKTEWEKVISDYKKLDIQSSIVRRIKVDDIFNLSEYTKLANTRQYSNLKQKVMRLYSTKKFRQASPRVMLTITKKIRNILKKEFKTTKKQTSKNDQLIATVVILLDCINYLDRYTHKKLSPSTKSEIEHEKRKLTDILDEFSPEIEREYVFDPMIYAKALYVNTVNYWQSVATMIFGR